VPFVQIPLANCLTNVFPLAYCFSTLFSPTTQSTLKSLAYLLTFFLVSCVPFPRAQAYFLC
jgi:hypothetical protein